MTSQRIQVNKTREDLRDQFKFFAQLILKRQLKIVKIIFWFLTVWTILLLVFAAFTSTELFITLKGVLIALTTIAWACAIIAVVIIILIHFKNKIVLRIYANTKSESELNYSINFDEEKIQIFSDKLDQEFFWKNYVYYREHNYSLFIVNETSPLETIYYSKNEIGENNYYLLKEIISKNLPKKI